MMLTIHGLPLSVKYQDLKSIIKERCNITDYILDNLVSDNDGTKKVRIGLADESEGSYLIKSLDGFRMMGNILRVVPIGKSQSSNPQNLDQQGGYAPRNDYPNQSGSNYGNRPMDMGRSDMMRPEPWGQGNNQWGSRPNQMGQPAMQQNSYNNYQQPQSHSQGMNVPYGQQQRPFDLRDQYQGQAGLPPQNQGYRPKNDILDMPARRPDNRSHVLRSVELVDEPMQRPIQSRYPNSGPGTYDQQKPVTIMKDNFQGPQYNLDRQPAQAQYQGSSNGRPVATSGGRPGGPISQSGSQWQAAPGQIPPIRGQTSNWVPNEYPSAIYQQDQVPVPKPSPTNFDRKFPDSKRPVMGKGMDDPSRNIDYNKGYEKPGPRFSPRRDIDPPTRRVLSPNRRMPSPGRRMPSPGRRVPSPGRRVSPGRRMSSPGRRMPSPGRRMPSPGRRVPSPGRRMPSPGRRMPSPGRRMPSPGRRMPSPERRMPSPGRRMASPGRRMPSPGRRMPSPGRRMPSPGKRISPVRRISPGRQPLRRPPSPGKRHSPGRYSPSRPTAIDKPIDKYGDRSLKDVRPAYDSTQASNQAIYSGGYRPSIHENVQYPIPGMRQPERRSSPWQDREKVFPPGMKKEDDRRDNMRMPVFEPRIDAKEKIDRSRSPRKSRSPVRDRFKKHSPSPRSPRRSWALEKRRSPEMADAPPPPLWPGASQARDESFRRFPDEPPKHVPVWEPRRADDTRRFDDSRRPDAAREPSPRYKPEDRFPPRFEPRDDRRPDDRRPDEQPKRFDKDFHRPDDRRGEFSRPEFPRREEDRKMPVIADKLSKELDDVYNRALEFKKRAEELRNRSERRRESREREKDFHDERRRERSRERHEFPPREQPREKRHEPNWKPPERKTMSPTLKAKRDKAMSEIAAKIVEKYGSHFTGDMKERVIEEMKLSVGKKIHDMFGYMDVSFIEMVIKFNAKHEGHEEKKLFNDVLASLPSQFRNIKRPAETEKPVVASKKPALSSTRDKVKKKKLPDWQPNDLTAGIQMVNIPPPTVQIPNPGLMSYANMQQQMMQHMMMTPYFTQTFEEPIIQQEPILQPDFQPNIEEPPQPVDQGEINLYLCKDDFEPYSSNQVDYLKKFLISQLVNYSGDKGWSPDFTVKGLQSMIRYEVVARDEATKQWLLGLDFEALDLFNVLVYTKEELWYERAAVWLPGHSRYRQLEPLDKLKLQNKRLSGVNVDKWKLVKKIVTAKGTRIYVDMPPSSARALEKHKMLLSYELQKVSVFLKAVAVDKEAFDMGLREPSLRDQNEIISAVNNSPMPSIANDSKLVKMCLKGNKALNVSQARKVKETIIYRIFKYHQQYGDGALRTDFINFGFCLPGHFCVLPENEDSAHWLRTLDIGKLNRHEVIVVGGSVASTKFIKMNIIIKKEISVNVALVLERLRQSNKGVKGLNFKLWKNMKPRHPKGYKGIFEVEMDLESVETIIKLGNTLDYTRGTHARLDSVAKVIYDHDESGEKLKELLRKYKSEQSDSYDVANMDIASSEDDDDLVFIGETNN